MTAREALCILTAHGYQARITTDGVLEATSLGVTKHGARFEHTDRLGSEISGANGWAPDLFDF